MNMEVLTKVASGLNQINCTWAIGGSMLLNRYKLVEIPNDIDILVDARDTKKIKEFMDTIGKEIHINSKGIYKTKEFFRYIVNDTVVEFMGDFKIDLGENKVYEFILDEKAIVDKVIIDNATVNFSSLEDWYVTYSVMKDPKKRIPLIKEYFIKYGIKHRCLLERSLNQDINEYIKKSIQLLLEGTVI